MITAEAIFSQLDEDFISSWEKKRVNIFFAYCIMNV